VFGTTLLVLPLALVSNDAVLLYNVVRLLTFLASALTAWWLARELGASEWIALAAGALFAFSPIRTDQVAHLSTLGTQWWPLVLLFTIRFAKRGRPADALMAALAFVLAFLACGYHGVIAAAVLPPFLAVLFWGRWQRLKWGAVAAVLAGLALLPLYRMHQKALEPERYARGTAETIQYSAPLESFLATSSWNRLYGEATDRFRAEGRPTRSPVSWCRRWSWPARSCCGGGASGRPARPGRSRRSSRRPRWSRSARGSAASGPTSAPGPGRSCGRRCRSSR
jgi:4-amino-4-deoxy-L-arabinose transferase-like glycosyltransferase